MLEYERNSSPSGLGLKIIGMDLKNEIDPDILSQLRSLWVEYSILIFSGQKLSHLEFEKFRIEFRAFQRLKSTELYKNRSKTSFRPSKESETH